MYQQKVADILTNSENYELVNMTAGMLEKKVTAELNMKSLKRLPADVYAGLFPKETRLPDFYGLPKIHKSNAPLRPVVAAYDSPLTAISILLERILHQLLPFVPAHIPNTVGATLSLKNTFQSLKVPPGAIIVTMDVVAMYPSIPIEDGISAVISKLRQHEEDIDTLGLPLEDIESLLRFVLTNNFFKFGDKVYRQKTGVAMGNHLAPPLAIVFMDRLESRMLQSAEARPEVYHRYVDDCLMVWCHGEAELRRFVDHCNRQHPSIRFTWESSLNGEPVNFMDMSICILPDYRLQYELYQKSTNSGINLNFESCIPQHIKRSVAAQQFRRASMLSSDPTAEQRSKEKIKVLLESNNFPPSEVKKAETVSRGPHAKHRKQDQCKIILRLPFCSDGLDRKIRRLVRKSRLPIMVTYKHGASIQEKLVRSALLPRTCTVHDKFLEQRNLEKRPRGKPRDDCTSCKAGLDPKLCDRQGAVYLLTCRLCSEEYVGESHRAIRTRIAEHHMQARNRYSETAWGEHMKTHPQKKVDKEPVFTARLLAIERNDIARKAREAIEIRERRPTINRNKGWTIN